jgi:Cys-tRNA(Pro)/Cys-tRNA(Cys) deacylase
MAKDTKTNAMRILEQKKIPFRVNLYECDEFIDGIHVADQLGQEYESSFKTLVAVGKSGGHYVFVLPIAEELDLKKAAKSVGEKSVELIQVKEIFGLTGYIRGGCTPIGMKKQFPTVIDETALLFDEIIISGGRLGAQIMIAPEELERAIFCKFEDITA